MRADPDGKVFEGRAVGIHRQDEFDVFTLQRAQVNIQRVPLSLVGLVPLPEVPRRPVPDLVIEAEDDVAPG